MAKFSRKKGTTSQILHVSVKDSASTTGTGKTGILYNAAGLVCKYINSGGTLSAAITLEDIMTLGTYQAPTSNTHMRFKEVSNVDPAKGLYELHVHNDWMSISGGNLIIMLAGASGMADCQLEIDLQADANLTTIQGDAQSVTDAKDFYDSGYDPGTNKVQGVVLVDTCTTNTDMRGTDSAATAASLAVVAGYLDTEVQSILDIVSSATFGNAALNTDLDTLLSRLTALRAGYLDNLSAGAVALEATLAAIKGATFDGATDSLESLRNRGDAAWLTADLTAVTATLSTIAAYVDELETRLTAVRAAKLDNLPAGIQKNTALNNFEFLMVDSTDDKTGKTGLTVTATRSIDGAAFGACANAAVEVSGGIYKINLAAADLNGDIVTFKFSATGANDRIVTVKTSL